MALARLSKRNGFAAARTIGRDRAPQASTIPIGENSLQIRRPPASKRPPPVDHAPRFESLHAEYKVQECVQLWGERLVPPSSGSGRRCDRIPRSLAVDQKIRKAQHSLLSEPAGVLSQHPIDAVRRLLGCGAIGDGPSGGKTPPSGHKMTRDDPTAAGCSGRTRTSTPTQIGSTMAKTAGPGSFPQARRAARRKRL